MFSTADSIQRKRSQLKWGVTKNARPNVASQQLGEDCISRSEQNYGNGLLKLRAALNEKELQLVELTQQHISVVNRAAIARTNWEDAITSKDQVIVQLQKALLLKKSELERQERVNEENVRRLLQQRQEEENAELAQKQRTISHLEQKTAQFVEELVQQQKTITKLRRQLEDRERHRASHLHKMEVINIRVQDLKTALQVKEEDIEAQKKYCQELRGMVWKRDSIIGQLQLAEQQLQSSLARQEAEHEVFECLKEKLQEEKGLAEKGLQEKEAHLRKQRRLIHDLQEALQSAEMALTSKHKDQCQLLEDNKRLMNRYDALRHAFEDAQRKQQVLQLDLTAVQERLSSAERFVAEAQQLAKAESTQHTIHSDGSITEDQVMDNGVGDFDAERQPMASIGITAMKAISRAGNLKRRSKAHFSQTSVLLKTSCPPFPSARDTVSFKTQQEVPGRLQRWKIAAADKNDHFSATECTRNANQSERRAWTFARTINSHSHPSRANVHFNQTAETRSSILSQSSQLSSPCARVGLDSSSEIDGQTGGERSPTPPEPSCFAERKQASIDSSRKRTNSQLHKSPCTVSARDALPPNDQSYSNFLAAKSSIEDEHKNWMCQESGPLQSLQPPKPLPFENQLKIVPNLTIPRSPRESETSGSSSLELQSCSYPLGGRVPDTIHKAGKSSRQGNGCNPDKSSRKLSSISGKMSRTIVNSPSRGTQQQEGRLSKMRQSQKPAAPASVNIHGASDTALKSLQEELVKRERGWRRTEANMRAALCQRLKELKDAEKLTRQVPQGERGHTIELWKA